MGDKYDASRVDFEFGGLHRKNDTCSPREGRVCREIAAAEAQVAETATHRRIIRFGFRKMAAQPLTYDTALLVGYVLEAYPSLMSVAFPRHFALDFELLIHARQFESKTERVFLRHPAGKLNRHAPFAEVDGLGFVAARAATLDRNFHCHPQLQSPFPLHQGPNCATTRFGAVDRKGLVDHEMSADFEASLESDGRFHQHDPEGSTVDRRGFGSPQYIAGFLNIFPIYDDRFETLAGRPAACVARL